MSECLYLGQWQISKYYKSGIYLFLIFVFFNSSYPSLQERDGFGGGAMGRRGRGDSSMGGPGGLQEVTYAVPADKCGLVIGKGKLCVFLFC